MRSKTVFNYAFYRLNRFYLKQEEIDMIIVLNYLTILILNKGFDFGSDINSYYKKKSSNDLPTDFSNEYFYLNSKNIYNFVECLKFCSRDYQCKMVVVKQKIYCHLYFVKADENNLILSNDTDIYFKNNLKFFK